MAQMVVQETTATHKKKPRKRVAVKQRVVSNGKKYDLRKLAARRTLTPRK
jgi:hypothetical protein